MAQLGGTAIPLTPDELQLSRGESLPDTARALSRYLDVLAVRTHTHDELEAWAERATIPVLNALTADEHPCQALADALTIRDRLGGLDGVRVAWVGDGSNVLVSLASLGDLLGYEVVAACPDGYDPVGANLALRGSRSSGGRARRGRRRHGHVDLDGTGARACAAARRPGGVPARRRAARRARRAFVMHCLPAHPGEEIEAGVLYGPRSAIWDEAENRLHVQKALLALVLGLV